MPIYWDFYSLPSSVTVLSIATSVTATYIFIRTLQDYLAFLEKLSDRLYPRLTLVIEQPDGLSPNHLYDAVDTYLSAMLPPSVDRIKVNKLEKDHQYHLSLSVDKNHDIPDTFQNGTVVINLNWVSQSTPSKYFELNFLNKHKETVISSYLPYVLKKAKEIKEERKTVRLQKVDDVEQGGILSKFNKLIRYMLYRSMWGTKIPE